MQYLGGKYRIAGPLWDVIASLRPAIYVEPFVGGAWVMARSGGTLCRIANDKNKAVVTMWREACRGWEPPDTISETLYREYKDRQDPDDPHTAFIAIGCSFAGKWFGGFAGNGTGRNYALNAKRSILKKAAQMKDVQWESGDYSELDIPAGAVVYCDPPYSGTTGYGGVGIFDRGSFWAWAREMSLRSVVLVSEYAAPEDFVEVASFPTTTSLRSAAGREVRTEKLFRCSNG